MKTFAFRLRLIPIIWLLAFTLLVLLVIVARAFAGAVSLAPVYSSADQLQQDLVPALATLASAWITWEARNLAMRWPFFFRWFSTPAAQRTVQQILNEGLTNGVQFALNKEHAWENVHQDVAVQGVVQSIAAQYVMDHYAETVKKLGLDPQALANKAVAFIPAPPAAAITAALNNAQAAK